MVVVMKKIGLGVCGVVLLAGCERPAGDGAGEGGAGGATTRGVPAVEGQTPEERDFGKRPLAVGRDEPEAAAAGVAGVAGVAGGATQPVGEGATEVEIGGKMVPLPPAVLRLSADGSAVLVADGGAAGGGGVGNVLFLQMTPTTDGGRPWTRAVWTFQLTSNEDEPTSGIFVGGPENQLRPVTVEMEILRTVEAPRVATVVFRGRFVPADSPDALTAAGYEVRGAMRVGVEGP